MNSPSVALALLLSAAAHLLAETPAGLRIGVEPGGYVALVPERAPVGEIFLLERSSDLVDWEPVMPARLSRADDPAITLPVAGERQYYRLVLNPAPDAAMIPVFRSSLATVPGFLLGKYEVTVGEWNAAVASAAAYGYDLAPHTGSPHPDLPVLADWYDTLKWCNLRSEIAGLPVAYHINGTPYRTGKSVPAIYSRTKGYRVPYNSEWNFAVYGGVFAQGFTYCGSNDIDEVAWYLSNSEGGPYPNSTGLGPRPVGWKKANELGLYDMNGNQWEWCWDIWPFSEGKRMMRGGNYATPKNICTCGAQGGAPPTITLGFRIARTP